MNSNQYINNPMCTMKDPKNVILSAIYKNDNKGEKKIYKKKGLTSKITYKLALISALGDGSCKVKISPNNGGLSDYFSFRQPFQLTEYLNKEYEEIVINMSQSEPLLRTNPPNAWTDPNKGQIPASTPNPSQSRVLEKAAAIRAEKERAAADKVTYVSKFMTLLDDATKANKTETIKIMTTYKTNNPNIFNITNKTIPVKELSTQNSKLQELIIRVEELNENPNALPPPPVVATPPPQVRQGNVGIKVPPKSAPPGPVFMPAAAEKITKEVPRVNPSKVGFNAPRKDSRTIHFYGNYEEEDDKNKLTRFASLASVLKLRIAEGNWIHYEKQKDDNAIEIITKKHPYLHLTLIQTVSDGNWKVSGYGKTGESKSYKIIKGEFPPKNKGGRVGGSKMGRSTVLGRIMSIIRGSIKHVTRKKGRKPRSKTRRYKNKSQKKEKNKLNITKKVRFNRNKI